jgi:hypothetical protein
MLVMVPAVNLHISHLKLIVPQEIGTTTTFYISLTLQNKNSKHKKASDLPKSHSY